MVTRAVVSAEQLDAVAREYLGAEYFELKAAALKRDGLPVPEDVAVIADEIRRQKHERKPDGPQPASTSMIVPHKTGGYGAAALAGECERVRTAPGGGRNDALNLAAFKVGQLVGAGHITRAEAERELWAAVLVHKTAGDGPEWDKHQAGTLKRGLDAGITRPRDPQPDAHQQQQQPGTAAATPTAKPAAEVRGRLNTVPDFSPFPLDALPAELRDLAAAGATAIGVDPSFIVLPGLSVLSAAVGSTHRAEVKPGWREPPYVSTLVVSPSGSKKTPAYKLACEDIAEDVNDDIEDEHAPELATWEIEHANWQSRKDDPDRGARPKQPPLRRFAVSDVTLERLIGKLQENPRGLLVCRDELDAWLRSFTRYATHGSSDLPTWLSLFGAGTVNYSRKTGTHQEVRVRGVGVSVTGGIQPGVLKEAMRPELMSAGLFARLALAMPPVPPRVWTDAEVSGRVVDDYKALVRRLFRLDFAERTDTGRTVPAVIPIDLAAKATFIDFYNRNGDAMALADANEAAARSKLEGYAVRLALVFNRCEPYPADEVKAEHMRAGVAVAEWFCDEIGRAQRLLTESNDVSALRDLARSVNRLAEKKGGRLTANWLHKANRGRFPTSVTAEAALESLVGAGLGRWDETPPGRGGQPTRFFTPLPTPLTPLPPLEDTE